MTAAVDRVRAHVYRTLAETGAAPDLPEIARAIGERESDVAHAIRELATRHIFILTPDGSAIERALPFSSVPTAFRVRAGDRAWWANCIWDALGIPPLIGAPGVVETTCPDCDSALRVEVDRATGPDTPSLIAHFLLPASRWYEDIRFT